MKIISSCAFIMFVYMLASCADDHKGSGTVEKPDSLVDSVMQYAQDAPVLPGDQGKGHPFDSLDFDRVIAYEFDGKDQKNQHIINKDGAFVKTIRKQKYLTASQVNMITRCLSDTLSYGAGTRPCFAPSEAIVFFNGTKPVMSIDICLDCNFLESSVAIPARNSKSVLVDGHTIPGVGFSKAGRQCIIDLSGELGFVYGNFKASE